MEQSLTSDDVIVGDESDARDGPNEDKNDEKYVLERG